MTVHDVRTVIWIGITLAAIAFVPLYVGYVGRVEIVNADRHSCTRGIQDRLTSIRVWQQQRHAAAAIGRDPFQSPRTRRARNAEARQLKDAIAGATRRVDPAHGGTLICTEAFPKPSVWSALDP